MLISPNRCDTHPILRSIYAAILFSLGRYNLCMFNTGINHKAGRSVLLANSHCSRDITGLLAASWLICIEHASQCASCIAPAKQKWQRTRSYIVKIGWVSQRIQRYLRLFHLRQCRRRNKRKYLRICCDIHPILRSMYAAILFSLGLYNLCIFNMGINCKAGRSVLLANSRCSRDITGLLAAPWLICIEHASQCASCNCLSETKMAAYPAPTL